MTDKAPNFTLGEKFNDAKTISVELSGNVIAGDFLDVIGVNSSQQLKMKQHTGTTRPRAIALREGKTGQMAEVLIQGITKITFGANVTPGSTMNANANKARNTTQVGNGLGCGYIISDGAADGDTGLAYFEGLT